MPFTSLLSNPFTNLGTSGNATVGVSSPIKVYLPPGTFSFQEWNTVSFLVLAKNAPMGTVLYWKVKHITTNNADFVVNAYIGMSGTTTLQYYDATQTYGDGIRVSITNDGILEGSEKFAFEFRTGSQTGPLIATIGPITITDYP